MFNFWKKGICPFWPVFSWFFVWQHEGRYSLVKPILKTWRLESDFFSKSLAETCNLRERERERGHAWIKSIRWNAFTTIIILDLSVKMSLDLIIYWTKVWKCILKLKMDNLVIITIIFIFTLFLLIFSINFLLFSFTFSNEKSGYPLSLSLSLSLLQLYFMLMNNCDF